MTLFQDLPHRIEQLALICPVLDTQHLRNVLIKLVDRQPRIKNISCKDTGVQASQDPAKRGGLSGSHLAGENDQAFSIFEPIIETRQNFVIAGCKNDEPWVRR